MGAGQRDEADDQKEHKECGETAHVEGSTAQMTHQDPGENRADEADGVLAKRHVECLIARQPGAGVEVRGIGHQPCSAEVLGRPREADNLGSAQVDPFETVEVARSDFDLLLDLVRVHHHGDRLRRVKGRITASGQSL